MSRTCDDGEIQDLENALEVTNLELIARCAELDALKQEVERLRIQQAAFEQYEAEYRADKKAYEARYEAVHERLRQEIERLREQLGVCGRVKANLEQLLLETEQREGQAKLPKKGKL